MINIQLLNEYLTEYGISVDENAPHRLDRFAQLLVEWNKVMNLTGITDPDEIVVKHFVDCLMLLKYVDFKDGASLIDVGTGAGFPAMPLLMARPELKVTFLDSLNKRLNFIATVLEENQLDGNLVHDRAEVLSKDAKYREAFDYATARAVAPMNVLCEYCLPYVKVGGAFVAMKGPDDDVTSAQNAIKELGGEIIDNFSYKLPNGDGRTIIVVKKISHTPTKYPRNSKKITTKPL